MKKINEIKISGNYETHFNCYLIMRLNMKIDFIQNLNFK